MLVKILFFLLVLLSAYASAKPFSYLSLSAKQALIVDARNGSVLFEKNPDTITQPHSLTKLMVVYLAFEAIKDKGFNLNDLFTVSRADYLKGRSVAGSPAMFLEPNSKVKLEDLIQGVIVSSANDAAIVIATNIAGSEENFVNMMNRKAASLGMTNTKFVNVTGKQDIESKTTARDMVKLGMAFLKNYSEYFYNFSNRRLTYNGITQYNRNPALSTRFNVDGFMASSETRQSFQILVTGYNDKIRLIAYMSGVPGELTLKNDTEKLFNWVFYNFYSATLFKKGDVIAKLPVWQGSIRKVNITAYEDIVATIPVNIDIKDVKSKIIYKNPLVPPVFKDDTIAYISIETTNINYNRKIPILAPENISRAGFARRLLFSPIDIINFIWWYLF